MRDFSLVALCSILFSGVLTAFLSSRWPQSITEVGLFCIFAVQLIWLAFRREHVRMNWILLGPAVFVLTSVLQLANGWTISPSDTLKSCLTWGTYLAALFIGLQIFDDRRREIYLRAFFSFGVVICIIALLQAFTAGGRVFWLFPTPGMEYVMGPFLYHSHYSAFVELLLPLALVPAIQDPGKRLRRFLIAGLLVASVITSASRAGFALCLVEIAIVVVVCGWRERQTLRRTSLALFAVLAMTVVLTGVVGFETLSKRLQHADAFTGRQKMLEASLQMIRDHWLHGVGLGAWPAAYPYYATYDDGLIANQGHNDWAQWTAEGGFLTLAAGLLMFGWAVRQSFRHVWCLGPVFVMIHALGDYPFQKPQLVILVFALLAAAAPGPKPLPRRLPALVPRSKQLTKQTLTL